MWDKNRGLGANKGTAGLVKPDFIPYAVFSRINMNPDAVEILFEDESLMVVNKPSGLLVIPTDKAENRTLTNLLNRMMERRGLTVKAHPCHRLDRETSGVILYAKGKVMQQKLMALFHRQEVEKSYIALVSGVPFHQEGEINAAIERKPALTRYRTLAVHQDYSVVEVRPRTGRTNQIRIHFKGIGHPLLGESKYAFRKDFKVKFKRVALHARQIGFMHPVSGERLVVAAPLPEDMKRMMKDLSL